MLPFPESICHQCQLSELIEGRNSQFLKCRASAKKYLPQPVKACAQYQVKASLNKNYKTVPKTYVKK